MSEVRPFDWLTLLALLLGPVLAVVVSLWRERRQEKHRLFQTLLVTRGSWLSVEHVRALNSISVVFFKYQGIQDRWQLLYDHFQRDTRTPGWNDRHGDLMAELLKEMARKLHYRISESELRRLTYTPQYHGDWEKAQAEIAMNWAAVLRGERALPVSVRQVTESSASKDPPGVLREERDPYRPR
jgi:hypothetical protein